MPEARNEEMTLKDLLLLLWDGRWIVAVCTVLAAIIGVLYAQSAKPIYKVDATLQIETKDGKSGGANPLGAMADIFEVTNPAETEIEIVKSRMVLGRVVQRMQLDVVAEPKGYGPLQRLLKRPEPFLDVTRFDVPQRLWDEPFELQLEPQGRWTLTSKKHAGVIRGRIGQGVDSTSNPLRVGIFLRGARDAAPGTRFTLVRRSPLRAIELLKGGLSAAEVGKKTGIIGLSFTDDDPQIATEKLNEIANVYVTQNVEQKSAEAEKTLEFLNDQLPEIKRSLEESEQRLNSYRSRVGSVDLDAQAQEALSQQVDVQQKLVDLQQKRKEVSQLFRPDHPNVRTIDSVRAVYQAQADREDRNLRALPLQQQEVVRLMRDVQVNTELYTGLLNNAQQLRVVKAGEIGNVRVVDPALPVLEPIQPKKKVVVLLSLVLGFFLGAGVVLVRRMFQGGVEDPKVVEKELALPVYASVPHSPAQERLHRKMLRKEVGNHLLASQASEDLALESFRSLRTTLRFSMLDAANNILLLVGPSPNIGKSFVCSNFAAVLAQAGSKVLLIDADLRRGRLHQYFGIPRAPGLSDVLSEAVSLEKAIQTTEVAGLSFLATGTIPPNPSELLLHENFSRFLDEVRPRYDYVVIDSAPVLAVTDAVILGKLAGTTLMVLKHGRHPLAEIEACQKRLSQAGVVLKGAVFNDILKSGSRYGARYGSAAYQYAYAKHGKGAKQGE